jgi:hypothetical protein
MLLVDDLSLDWASEDLRVFIVYVVS